LNKSFITSKAESPLSDFLVLAAADCLAKEESPWELTEVSTPLGAGVYTTKGATPPVYIFTVDLGGPTNLIGFLNERNIDESDILTILL
jgi:hypothetical protein